MTVLTVSQSIIITDALWQVVSQYPTSFEYNVDFLVFVTDHSYTYDCFFNLEFANDLQWSFWNFLVQFREGKSAVGCAQENQQCMVIRK